MNLTFPVAARRALAAFASVSLVLIASHPAAGQCERAKLIASNPSGVDLFGAAAAISGNSAVVGAPNADIPLPPPLAPLTNAGRAYVYTRSGDTWTQQAILIATDAGAGDNFGTSVAILGNTIVVGARLDDNAGGVDAGAAYIFTRSGTVWTQQAKITASDGAAGDYFGASVSITSTGHPPFLATYIVVGAPGDDNGGGTDAGAAYVFERPNGSTAWTQQAKLVAGDAGATDQFGTSVGISGDAVVVGCPFDDRPGLNNAGAAYIFRHAGSTWTQEAKLFDTSAASNDQFGQSVAIDGTAVLIGAPNAELGSVANSGLAYIFRHGTTWTLESVLVAYSAHANDYLGSRVALSGDQALLAKSGPQTVQVTRKIGANWYPLNDLDSSVVPGGNFGTAVAIDGTDAIIGADLDTAGSQALAGAAYHFAIGEEGSDACAGATVISAGSYRGCTVDATLDGSVSCVSVTAPDVWYSYTPSACSVVRFDTIGSDFDTVLSIHSGCPGNAGNQIACDDDSGGSGTSLVEVAVTPGTTYLIRVSGYFLATGRYILNVSEIAPPNDNCANAQVVGTGTVSSTTCRATTDGSCSCTTTNLDVWYSYTPPCDGLVRFDTIGSAFDTVLSIHSGCPGGPANQLACNDDGGGNLTSLINFNVVGGTTYLVRLAGYNSSSGTYTLHITGPTPPNDTCGSATIIGEGAHAFSTCFADTDGSAFGGGQGTIRSDVWFRYTAPRTRPVTVATCDSGFDTAIAVYADSCPGGAGTLQAFDDNSCGLQSRLAFSASQGITYLIRVGGIGAAQGSGVLVVACPADLDADGLVTSQDFFTFLTAFFANSPDADFDRDGSVNSQDFFEFLASFFAGC